MTIGITAVTATSVSLFFNNLAGDGTIDLQLAHNPDFAFCACPVLSVPRAEAAVIEGLNQRATVYARCRPRRASGLLEPWSGTVAFRTADGPAQNTAPAPVMIEPVLFVVPEPVMSWTASSAAPGFPAANLGIDAPVGWKSTAAPSFIDAMLSGAPIDTIAVLNTNIPEDGTVSIFAAPSTEALNTGVGRVAVLAAAPFRASANLPGRPGYHGLFRFDPVSMPCWRVSIDGTLPTDTIWVEHVIFGKNRATKNHSIDKSEAALPRGSVDRTRSGIADRPDGLPMRRVEFEISMMTEAQYETTYADLHRFENEAVLVVPNSKAGAFLHDRILFGDLRSSRTINPFAPRFTRSFTIESLI